jgi:adenosylcobinamide kinase / adenosylcobinamide-phosphate guanylyltransferase
MIDSLGSWLTAALDRLEAWSTPPEAWTEPLADQVTDLVDAWRACRRIAVAVTNEVGLGLVSAHRSGRVFTDRLGDLNQAMARASDDVILMVAGRALPL